MGPEDAARSSVLAERTRQLHPRVLTGMGIGVSLRSSILTPTRPLHSSKLASGRQTYLDGSWYLGASFSPDSKLFAVGGWGKEVRLWETATRKEVTRLSGFLGSVWSVAFSPDGKRLATASNGKETIKLWDVESHQELLILEGQGSWFDSTAFSPDGNVLGSKNSRAYCISGGHRLGHRSKRPSERRRKPRQAPRRQNSSRATINPKSSNSL